MATPVATPLKQAPVQAPSGKEGQPAEDTSSTSSEGIRKWRLEKMIEGASGVVEQTGYVSKSYVPTVIEIAERFRQFKKSHKLSREQWDFLESFDQAGGLEDQTVGAEKLLETEAGIIAADRMVTQEVLFRLLALGQSLDLTKKGVAGKTAPETLRLLSLESGLPHLKNELNAVLQKLTGSLGIFHGSEGSLDLTPMADLDISRLPQVHREYIEWCQSGINKENVSEYILNAAKNQLIFYRAIGISPRELNAATPWERLNLDQTESRKLNSKDIAQNISSYWNLDYLEQLKILSFFERENLTPQDKLELAFEAHRNVVAKWTRVRLTEINSGEISGLSDAVGKIEERRTGLEKPEIQARSKERIIEKINEVKEDLTKAQSQLKKYIGQLDEADASLNYIEENRDVNQAERERLQPEVNQLEAERSPIIAEQEQAQINFQIRFEQARDAKEEQRHKSNWEHQKAEFERRLKPIDVDRGYIKKKARLDEIIALFDSEPGLHQKKAIYEHRITSLRETRISGLESRLDDLEEQLETGLAPANKVKLEQFDAVLQALKKYPGAQGILNEKQITDFTDSEPDPVVKRQTGNEIPAAYIAYIDLIFNTDNPPGNMKKEEYRKRAMEVLPQDTLANILAETFDVSFNAGDPLKQVLAVLKARKIGFIDVHGAIAKMIYEIRDKGLNL
ncbi:hypothetical protein A3E42_06545 [Candidatus Gottesmanbacteria bacterium RIFCSPHIGHO2_12_FULL_40_13]|nr:MAG: hypothetical protein A3E42_06545 [Candidatus Gottesmanbacteria bacterium RIFCSPHIGHO2_12_FULL_40_13]